MMRFNVLIVASLFLSNAALAAPPIGDVNESEQLKKKCLEEGKEWRKVGMLQMGACIEKSRDGGKACTSSKDCQFWCEDYDNRPVGTEVVGTCAKDDDRSSCHTFVENGRVKESLCED